MADEEELAPEAGTEPIDAPDEGEEQEQTQTADPFEELATEWGWVPQDKFRGPAEAWRPAKEFIKYERDRSDGLSRELRSVKDEVGRMARVSSQLLEDKISERDAYWQQQHAQAVQDGDYTAADRAVQERFKLSQQAQQAQPQQGFSETTQAWMARNTWFNSDPLAKVRAQEIAARLAADGLPEEEQLRQAERAIRKEFPEHFPQASKQPAAVQTAQTRTSQPSNKAKGFNDMPAAAQEMARDYQKRHGIKVEEFAKSYWDDQAKQRRVG